MSANAHAEVATRLSARRSPVIAVLDSGLDPFAALAAGTRVVAARSFLDGHPFVDGAGTGTACANAVADTFAGRWGADGACEVRLVVAQIVDADGIVRVDALAKALGWVRALGVDAIAIGWGTIPPEEVQGPARRLARSGVRLLRADQPLRELLGAGVAA